MRKVQSIGIISPSGKIQKIKIENARNSLISNGFNVKIGKYAYETYHKFAGTDDQRASDFNEMIYDDKIDLILCSRGGYGALRILDKIDLDYLQKNPKPIAGLSDITTFHIPFNNKGLATLHSLMPNSFPLPMQNNSKGYATLMKALKGDFNNYTITGNKNNKSGNATGVLTGGNLSLIYALQGTPYQLQPKNKILFIEEISEHYYQIDRMMTSLRLAGVFKEIKGLIVGQFTDCKEDNFGVSIEEIILDAIKKENIPVCFNFPAGHMNDTHALLFGKETNLEVNKQEVRLI